MEQKRVRIIGDPVLRKKARPVKVPVSKNVSSLIDEMFEVMESEGIGLAAPQIGESIRLIVVDTRENGHRFPLINPRIVSASGKTGTFNEGCLSVPGVSADVVRPLEVVVEGLDRNGKQRRIEADGILARVLQHEIDHLDGILFVDHLPAEEREALEPELKALSRTGKRSRTTNV